MNTVILILSSLLFYFVCSFCVHIKRIIELKKAIIETHRFWYSALKSERENRLYMQTDLTVRFTDMDHVTIMQIPGYTDDGHRLVITVVGTHKPTLLRAMNALVLNSNCKC